jgi:flagellar biosynthesis GTPase FlhF
MNNKDQFFKRIQKLHEDDFSKTIIIPLLRKIGYHFVDFNGGPYEQGKDIIAYKPNEFDDIEVTVIQSKMFKSVRTSVSSQLFSAIVHQLFLCSSKKIPCSDGVERTPSKILLITPFSIDTRHLSEQFEKIKLHNIGIFDQAKLTSLLDKYWPEIYEPEHNSLTQAIKLQKDDISNIELYRALHIESKTTYSNYYSDLNFFVGETESREVFSSSIHFSKTFQGSYEEFEWQELKRANKWLEECVSYTLIQGEIESIESTYDNKLSEYNKKENQTVISTLARTKLNAQILKDLLTSEISVAKNLISAAITTSKSKPNSGSISPETLAILKTIIDKIEDLSWNESGHSEIEKETQSIHIKKLRDKKIRPSLLDIGSLAREIHTSTKLIEELEISALPFPNYEACICEKDVELKINNKIKDLSSQLTQLNNRKLTNTEARTILDTTNLVLRCVDNLTKNLNSNSLKVTLRKDTSFANELDISAHTIFDSGCNVALYGDAGAGKSTTLYVYAEKLYKNKKPSEEILFIPLNRVTSRLGKATQEQKSEIIDESSCFNSLINSFLLYRDVDISSKNRTLLIETLSKKSKVTIIIDALDESANNSDWIIPALSELPKHIPQAQVITSSRNCVSFIKEIEFLGITLLPFNSDQLRKFIFGWLADEKQCNELWDSIESNELFEVAKNPLLATIICTLHENGIPVPENEPDVYRRKIELLCGLYDQSKGIKRAVNEKSFLEKCCQKIAYQLHVRSRREASVEELRSYLTTGLEARVTPDVVNTALSDLIDVCNILIKSSDGNSYSFGHLRIQESLAAEELERNRSIDIIDLMTQSWWRGALYLYSFNNNIQPLIDQVYERHSNFIRHKSTLHTMINSQPKHLQSALRNLLLKHEYSDIKDGFNDYGIIDSDYEEVLDADLRQMFKY